MKQLLILALFTSASVVQAQDSPSPKCVKARGVTDVQIRTGTCGFDKTRRRFAGTASEKARCLLRQVKRGRELGDLNAPAALTARAGAELPFSLHQLLAYTARRGIAAADIGLVQTSPIEAEYFVIHDTSSPNCTDIERPTGSCPTVGAFPPLMNDAQWPTNRTFGGHKPPGARRALAHAWTNRVGDSIVETPFDRHISHLKFDYCHDSNSKRGLFLGVENIQPRIGDPPVVRAGRRANDLVAPDPGFTDPQYQRLALLYAAASARRGHWLVPGYHAVIDKHYGGGHDDPQNFDANRFEAAIAGLVAEVAARR